MTGAERFSSTMRIDLIPDVPLAPVNKRQPVIQGASQRPVLDTPRIVSNAGQGGAFYQRLLQGLYDAALISEMDGRIADVNQRAIDFLGLSKDELCRLTVFDIVSGADESLIGNLCENLKTAHHALIQGYCKRKDETYFPAEIAVSLLKLDVPHLCFFVRDITIRKQAEEMLITEHCAIQNSGAGIAITDNDGVIEFVNPQVAELWQCTEERLIGRRMHELMRDVEDVDAMMQALAQDDSYSWREDMVALRADHGSFDIQVTGTRNRNSDGESIGFVFSIMDISDRKRAEGAERVSERRRVMLESLGAACHHVGQPATILMANLQFLKERMDPSDVGCNDVLDKCLVAMDELSQTLGRLNRVNEYKTRQYLEGTADDDAESRILDI